MSRETNRQGASGRRRFAALAGALATLALIGAGAPGAAQASHDNGAQICSNKFAGSFTQIGELPLYRNGPGTRQLGRVTINAQYQDNRRTYRVCTVTIRRYHSEPKDTWAVVQRDGAYYRIDRGPFYRYAGPVVGAMKRGQTINGKGRIVGACASFRVHWPSSGAPQLDGGGCA